MARVSNRKGAGKCIAVRAPFEGSNLRGMDPRPFAIYSGRLDVDELERLRLDSQHIDYVVLSYATPIAWHRTGGRGWYVVEQKFSQSTTNHQNIARRAIEGERQS